MAGLALNWPAEAIWEKASALLPAFNVEVLPTLDSTNSELLRRARTGRTEPTLLVAEHQSAGRGRRGRDWQALPPGQSLSFSLGLPLAPKDWLGLSLAVGVALAEALPTQPPVQLKWPNDLWWCGRKLGGILIETVHLGEQRHVVIGVGLNIRTPQVQGATVAPVGLAEAAMGLSAPDALALLVLPLLRSVKAFEGLGFAPFQARFAARDALRGQRVEVVAQPGVAHEGDWQGQAQGVDEQGALCVQVAGGLKRVVSSEVSVRPLQAAPAAAASSGHEVA